MSKPKPDFSKLLFTGIKRKKTNPIVTESDDAALRMRVMPKKLLPELLAEKKHKHSKLDDEADDGVALFSGEMMKAIQSSKKKAKFTETDQKELERLFAQHVRRINNMYVVGEDIPAPILEFDDLKFPKEIDASLKEFNIIAPSPIQMQALPLMRQKRNLLATAPTGSGKTLAFVLPLIQRIYESRVEGSAKLPVLKAIVLEPTRVLGRQVYVQFVKYCQNLNLKYAFYEGDGPFPSGVEVVVTTPNRLIAAVEDNKKAVMKMLKTVEWVVVDECDRMFDDKDTEANFKSKLAKILEWTDHEHTRRAFFSATNSSEVESYVKANLKNPVFVFIGSRNSANTQVTQQLVFAGSEGGKIAAIRDVLQGGFDPPALIFVQDKDRAGQLYTELVSSFSHIPIAMVSSEVTDAQKEKILDNVRAKRVFVLICTELIGRGIDLPSVNLVINFDLPATIVNYVHRIGRTGRAGRPGRAITYFTETDLKYIRPIASLIKHAGFDVPAYTLALEQPTAAAKKVLSTNGIHRKSFGGVRKWERVKAKKQEREELVDHSSAKGAVMADDDAGGDLIDKARRAVMKKRTANALKMMTKKKGKKTVGKLKPSIKAKGKLPRSTIIKKKAKKAT
uniref:RNA helicase n=1 Tax=Panagrellus redivivus TaxID=6233 RepID=A0A7E4UR41_PANRE